MAGSARRRRGAAATRAPLIAAGDRMARPYRIASLVLALVFVGAAVFAVVFFPPAFLGALGVGALEASANPTRTAGAPPPRDVSALREQILGRHEMHA